MAASRVFRWSVLAALLLVVSSFAYAGAVGAHTTGTNQSSSGSTYSVTFTETGLSTGTNWTVGVAGGLGWNYSVHQHQTSSSTSIIFTLPNGSYRYRVRDVPGYQLTSGGRGEFNVTGASPSPIAVTFSKLVNYTVTFTEKGLPAGTNWSVLLHPLGGFGSWGWYDHGHLFEISNTTTITFSVPNGSYAYRAHAHGFHGTNSTRGIVNVSGASPAPIVVTFVSVSASATHYTVSFQETGLPSGTNWTVRVAPTGGWGWSHGRHRALTETTSNSTLNFSLPNGTYRYFVFGVPGYAISDNGSHGTFNVTGASPAAIHITFVKLVTYAVTFEESGLPSGTNWTVAVYGWAPDGGVHLVQSSNTTTITFELTNGTYRYHVFHVDGYSAGNTSFGKFNVTGASPSTIMVTFTQQTYSGALPAAGPALARA